MPHTSVISDGHAFTESPRWHEGRLWFVDMNRGQVLAVEPGRKPEVVTDVPGRTGGIGWLPDGRLLVVQQEARTVLRLEPQGLVVHADLSAEVDSMLNDMWVDSTGRAWVGEMGFDPHDFLAQPEVIAALTAESVDGPLEVPSTSRIFAVEPDGSCHVAASDLVFTNGIVVDERRRRLVVAETFGARLTVFDIDENARLCGRREWPLGFAPDGIALAPEGEIWVADPMHLCARRVGDGGTETGRIKADQLCLACATGGAGSTTLYLCTAPTTDLKESLELNGARIDAVPI
ncbi:gluconolactonase [Prauserella sp. PE36]|uniref:SMP-30/gluconolactonase/LRE family protein n=1 Tax=Prauserella endophytica TaxID=1592324 RepID=A0ABY2RV45_9PSEU|nr:MULTISPECIES: SMP-30/gluconolactonase/LRE family protein [Prauserella]PXY23226.1 hypothetical protein BAY59_26395 [Prauserella coralliicola]RBM18819.1 gluconolactonase [Prauserella sp. PE36]TKG61836.1 SMP-30/gluconolactonase/LRE family protein [Prauserella endophytica]